MSEPEGSTLSVCLEDSLYAGWLLMLTCTVAAGVEGKTSHRTVLLMELQPVKACLLGMPPPALQSKLQAEGARRHARMAALPVAACRHCVW